MRGDNFALLSTMGGGSGGVHALFMSPDGSQIIAETNESIKVWNLHNNDRYGL